MIFKLTETKEELEQILALQNENHLDNVSKENQLLKGFVTVKHSFDLLHQMHLKAPQIIAIENGIVVAYALVMLKDFKKHIPILLPMFHSFSQIIYKEKRISDYSYYIMGQICIKESHRSKGLFQLLYAKHKEVYASVYDLCITEVSTSNIPSTKAHLKVGFTIAHHYSDNQDTWNVLVWDWK